MGNANHVIEASSEDFAEQVLGRSHQLPVLVDFWAPWCGPCRFLTPTLEKLAEELDGAFLLAKVNSDDSPDLAARYGVRGIPNVQLFVDGEVADQFVGALPEEQVRQFLRPWCPTEADRRTEEGRRRLESGDVQGARRQLQAALESDPEAAGARLELARLALAEGDFDQVRDQVERVAANADEYDAAQSVLAAAALASEAADIGSPEECVRRAEEDPTDAEALYALGGHALAQGRFRDALERYLEVARIDPRWRDEAPRRAMVAVFGIVGVRDPLSDEYRDRLRNLYY